jgi:hypothetical protein
MPLTIDEIIGFWGDEPTNGRVHVDVDFYKPSFGGILTGYICTSCVP